MDYFLHILIVISLFAALAESLDLVVGHTGLLSVCQAAFWGLGAYSSAIMTRMISAPFSIGLIVGAGVSVLLSLLVSLPSLRLRDEYFVIATFGMQIIVFSIFNNWMNLTRGPLGIPSIPQPVIFGWRIDSPQKFLALSTFFAVIACVIIWRLSSSPFGRVLHAIREDEAFAKSLGKNTMRFKVTAFAISAAIAATAGSLYAHYFTYIDPTNFTVMESIMVISMVVIGGAGSRWGPLIGAFVLVSLPEVLRFIGLPSSVAANLRQIFYGSLLVIMVIFRPRGFAGHFGFGR